MDNNEKAMKYFVIFALGAALLLPVGYEVYANISRGFGMLLVIALAAAAGVKFSALPIRSAMLGVTAYVFSGAVLSMIGYVIIHPAVRRWLEANSKYFDLPLVDMVGYWGKAFGLLACSYLFCFARLGLNKAMGKLEKNSAETASAIDNAFEDMSE